MTGLNLETFLHLLRADLGAWASLGAIVLVLALMTWTSWGSRKVLRKCLVLSVVAHLGLALFGSTLPMRLLGLRSRKPAGSSPPGIQQVRVIPQAEGIDEPPTEGRRGRRAAPAWDRPDDLLAVADPVGPSPRPDPPARDPLPRSQPAPLPTPADPARPEPSPPSAPSPETRAAEESPQEPSMPPARVTPSDPNEIAAPVVAARDITEPATPPDESDGRLRPELTPARAPDPQAEAVRTRPPLEALSTPPALMRPDAGDPGAPLEARPREATPPAGEIVPPEAVVSAPDPGESGVASGVRMPPGLPQLPSTLPEADIRSGSRPSRVEERGAGPGAARRGAEAPGPIALSRVAPAGLPRLPEVQGTPGGHRRGDVPEVYRSRLDPNRSALAGRAGASSASEQAVERALDWLMRHQDSDGRWDGATAKDDGGGVFRGDDDYTIHCPPGEPCFGECIYWEADTALTGLALLSFLGAGYTQTDGKYADTVGKGLDFLLAAQKPDGDLRGMSRAVGMYCHAMATLALCEAYALTGEDRLRVPVERAVGYIVRSRARDGMAWRYAPGAPAGDTSILGWVVLALKSAKLVGISTAATTERGTLEWLHKVSSGSEGGLASYQPSEPVTPTMTAEAWVCRQFLGVGGPGPASTEAALSLLENGPDRGTYNLYYWYYGTLAMYQHGGDAWSSWNAQVRDQVVRRQRVKGHSAGSWDPDDSMYGARGGRIYCTALATLTLEVYYRFLRLYDEPKLPPTVAPAPERSPDPSLRRIGTRAPSLRP